MKTCRCDKCGLRWPEEETAPFLLWRHVQHAFAYNPQILCLLCYREFYPNAYREYMKLRIRRERQLDALYDDIDAERRRREKAKEKDRRDDVYFDPTEDTVEVTEYHPGIEPPTTESRRGR